MRTQMDNNKLTIYLDGRIDSNNAGQAEQEILAAVDAAPGCSVELDAENLEYISSAGLRVLMKLRKQVKTALPVLNVSPEVYDIFEVTGFSELLEVHKKLREVSVEGCALLGEGANGKVYRFTEDEMIKVFRQGVTLDAIEQEREASRKAFLLGVPCAIAFDTVRCGESYGTIYELLKAATLTERIRKDPDTLPRYAEASARLLHEMHQIEVPDGQMQKASRLPHAAVDAVAPDFSPEEIAQMHRLYDAIPEMRRFIHNDYHAKNVMESDGELILIDLGDAGAGNPLIDLIHCYMVYMLIGGGLDRHAPDEMSFIGLTYGEMKRFWDIFLPTYCGSEAEAQRLNRILAPYAQMMYLTASMSHPMLPAQYHAAYAQQVRQQVFPHAEEMRGSIAEARL
ncbi:MAG: anti-sigma factor antagonist [Oscillospiraceae bacterium]|nr:anti-sigma factor antagonist [Oscillospiraceae bacterium]